MAISWLTALKVIPWGDVIEHAPAVLKGARELLDRQRRRDTSTPTTALAETIETPATASPELRALQQQLTTAHEALARVQQTQDQITQTLAELAEQNTRLVAAVELLRKRTRLLMGAAVGLAVALAALWFSGV